MAFIFEDSGEIYVGNGHKYSVLYMNGSIYHNFKASNDEIISSLNIMIHDGEVLIRQAALMSLIHKTMDVIKERHCS